MIETIAFYFFAVLVIAMFTITVTTRQPVYAFSALAAGMILISAFFFMLKADFMGVVQIVVYTGAVMALYAFGMMFFDSAKKVNERIKKQSVIFLLSGLSAALVVAMVAAPIAAGYAVADHPVIEGMGNTETLGLLLFTKYLIPFELAGLLLLTAMICGIVLASKKMEYAKEENL